ncbi:hypothetical protein WJX77_000437 [Trebouxia sp. C0004]
MSLSIWSSDSAAYCVSHTPARIASAGLCWAAGCYSFAMLLGILSTQAYRHLRNPCPSTTNRPHSPADYQSHVLMALAMTQIVVHHNAPGIIILQRFGGDHSVNSDEHVGMECDRPDLSSHLHSRVTAEIPAEFKFAPISAQCTCKRLSAH